MTLKSLSGCANSGPRGDLLFASGDRKYRFLSRSAIWKISAGRHGRANKRKIASTESQSFHSGPWGTSARVQATQQNKSLESLRLNESCKIPYPRNCRNNSVIWICESHNVKCVHSFFKSRIKKRNHSSWSSLANSTNGPLFPEPEIKNCSGSRPLFDWESCSNSSCRRMKLPSFEVTVAPC